MACSALLAPPLGGTCPGVGMRPTRALVFDLDGTLIDSRADIAAAANHMLDIHGFPSLPVDTIAGYVGDGARLLVARCTGLSENAPELDALLVTFLDYYTGHPTDRTRFMPAALETLDALAAMPLAICTNKPRRTTDVVLAALGLAPRFQVVVAGGDFPQKKPEPEPLLHIAGRLALDPRSLVIVGDGPQDVECGRAVGARTVGVEGGIIPTERLVAARPDELLPSLAGLPALVARWRTGA
jgi:phosphoglycolate phosphatase